MSLGTLNLGEPHPAAHDAYRWIRSLPADKLALYQEALSSTAIEGNRLAQICSETLHRFVTGQPVSDRYLLGLAWFLRGMSDKLSEEG